MISGGKSPESSGFNMSSTTPPLGTQATQAFAGNILRAFAPFYLRGDVTSPIIKTLSNLAYAQGRKESGQARKRILTTPGITSPAKAAAVGDMERQSIEAAAGVPTSIWGVMSTALLSLLGPTSVSYGKSKSGGGWNFGIGT